MDRVKQTVQVVLNLPNSGGRLMQRDEFTLVLMDYDFLPYTAIQLIADQHPGVMIDTHHSDHSSSGYVVIFTLSPVKSVFRQPACMQIFVTITFVLVVVTLPVFDCWRLVMSGNKGPPTEDVEDYMKNGGEKKGILRECLDGDTLFNIVRHFFVKNHSVFKSFVLMIVYFAFSVTFWNISINGFAPGQRPGSDQGTLPFDHVFRSLHVVPTTLTTSHHVPSYWTLDWLTHAAQKTADNGAATQPSVSVNSHSCMERNVMKCIGDWGETATKIPGINHGCITKTLSDSSTNPDYAKIAFSCAMTANQTRYSDVAWNEWNAISGGDWMTQQDVCAYETTNARRAACQMQRTNALSLVVNDDKSFSMSSGHSQMVLLFYASNILFIVQVFFFLSSRYVRWWLPEMFVKDKNDADQMAFFKKCVGLLWFLAILGHRIQYGNREQAAGMEVSTPNGTFFYGMLSYLVVMWFAASESDLKNVDFEYVWRRGSEPGDKVGPAQQPLMNTMELNVSAFNGNNKIKTKAFLQPGKGNYENAVEFHSDLDSNVKLTESAFTERPKTSLWALTQLWVWPLLALSTLTVKSNYQLDINVTIVFAGTFVIGLIDLFGRRLLELTRMYKNAIGNSVDSVTDRVLIKSAPKDHSVDYGIRLVYIVGLVLQLALFLLVFRTAGWGFFGSDVKNSAEWLVGAPQWYQRHRFIDWFTMVWSLYWLLTLIVKLLCLGPAERKVWSGWEWYFSGERWYASLDGLNFTILNIFMVFLLSACIHLFGNRGDDGPSHLQYYTAGVYVKAIAAKLT